MHLKPLEEKISAVITRVGRIENYIRETDPGALKDGEQGSETGMKEIKIGQKFILFYSGCIFCWLFSRRRATMLLRENGITSHLKLVKRRGVRSSNSGRN